MIGDVIEFRRTGMACRWVTDLDIPVAAWRAAMCDAGRRDGARVRTFLIPPTTDANVPPDQLVFAVRTDPPPDPAVQERGLLRWWPIDELNMPFDRWRGRCAAQPAESTPGFTPSTAQPPSQTARITPDQLVYAFWSTPVEVLRMTAATVGCDG